MGRGPPSSVVLQTRGHRATGVAQSLLGTPYPCRCHRESDSELIAGSHLTDFCKNGCKYGGENTTVILVKERPQDKDRE